MQESPPIHSLTIILALKLSWLTAILTSATWAVGQHFGLAVNDGYEDLFYTNEATFREKGAKIFMESSVTNIDFNEKIVHFENKAGEKSEESYDKLILATGSKPIIPNIPGKDLEGLHFLKLFQEGQEVDRDMSRDDVQTVAVIGAGSQAIKELYPDTLLDLL